MRGRLVLALGTALLTSCSQPPFPADQQYGANPRLPEPKQFLFPPMGIANPVGFKADEVPMVPNGFAIKAFARATVIAASTVSHLCATIVIRENVSTSSSFV